MSVAEFSLDGLADSLICQLDRSRIFPPYHNDAEEYVIAAHSKNKMPKRSPNAFLLCRKNVHKEAKRLGVSNMRVISKVTGILWRESTVEEKEVYEDLSKYIRDIYVQRDNSVTNSQYISNHRYMPYAMPYSISSSQNMYLPPTIYEPMNSFIQDNLSIDFFSLMHMTQPNSVQF
ncbi:9228_t:CDS:2 [Cetraspora pellucida]|uniref:15838_t:CDS:1 n=2 Tax=Cetraspora pellucida TaxID=1433469 RepID=A0A9N9G124_9GLOM|nr:9228_t:CDS:2 [Cetraspora pellucida]CAG8570042.1 15838_t:CDS:2 [Cetraspora pellucida]